MTTKTTNQATIYQSSTNWNDIRIEIDTDPDEPDTIWRESTAHDFANAQFDDVEFDSDQWEADIDEALADYGWERTSALLITGDFTQTCTVKEVAS